MAMSEFLFVMVVPVRVNMLNIRRRRCLMPSKSAGWRDRRGNIRSQAHPTVDLVFSVRLAFISLPSPVLVLSAPPGSFLWPHFPLPRVSPQSYPAPPLPLAHPLSHTLMFAPFYSRVRLASMLVFINGRKNGFCLRIRREENESREVLEVREFSGLGSRQGAELDVEGVAPGLFIDGRRLLCTSSSPLLQQE